MTLTSSDVLAILGGVGALVTGAAYLLKRVVDRLVAVQLAKIQDRNRAAIEENSRRQAALFDEQYAVLKMLTTLIYRARNVARVISEGKADETRPRQRDSDRLRSYHDAIETLLYDERAILAEDLFKTAHLAKRVLVRFLEGLAELDHASRIFQETDEREGDRLHAEAWNKMKEAFQQLDEAYTVLLSAVQAKLSVEAAPPNKALQRPGSAGR